MITEPESWLIKASDLYTHTHAEKWLFFSSDYHSRHYNNDTKGKGTDFPDADLLQPQF